VGQKYSYRHYDELTIALQTFSNGEIVFTLRWTVNANSFDFYCNSPAALLHYLQPASKYPVMSNSVCEQLVCRFQSKSLFR